MRKKILVGITGVFLIAGAVFAEHHAELVALDDEWGSTEGTEILEKLLADSVISVDPEGVTGKAEMIAAADSAEPPTGPYEGGDHKVNFLSDDIAVMAHSVGGDDPHWSMHVFQKIDGAWKIVATASMPAE